jgi:hypothetical protein
MAIDKFDQISRNGWNFCGPVRRAGRYFCFVGALFSVFSEQTSLPEMSSFSIYHSGFFVK